MSIAPSVLDHELLLASRVLAPGLHRSELSVPSIHCGACVARIERLLGTLPEVERARANLSTRRVTVDWRGQDPPGLIAALDGAGYAAHLHDPAVERGDGTTRELVRALAVAAFAAGNIMMLSVAVWAGADPESRDIFHWLSAAIALPALAYSGRVFFRSAWQAVRHGRTNMDVPVSIGVLLAFGMSLYETMHHGPHAYFDAATSLLFVLLVGRTLDHVMRERASTAVDGLARLAARGATVRQAGGTRYLPVDALRPGMILLLAAGERVPVDGRVVAGRSEIDASLVSGESVPRPVAAGEMLQAGTLNTGAPIEIEATATADASFLAEVTRLVTAADSGRAAYRRLADRAARLYAPVVHLTALATFAGWMIATNDAHAAISTAIAVLIITCPCALGLAVPMVQVVANQRLFAQGVMVKGGGALERLAEVDHVVFDKTGTLTAGMPRLVERPIDASLLAIAAAMASRSRHPYAQAIADHARAQQAPVLEATGFGEHPGDGLEARIGDTIYRLGRPGWALADAAGDDGSNVVLSAGGRKLCGFTFDDSLRAGAQDAIAALRARGLGVEIVSGDRDAAVRRLAAGLGVPFQAEVTPAAKVARIAALAAAGHRVLMVGDGLNDAPALAAAHVSMAVSSATDVGRSAADIVFLRESLDSVGDTLAIARSAGRLVRQNLWLAAGYNALAIPIAVLGLVTPLIAAIAMSASSLLVVANALRLARRAGAAR